MSESWSKTIMSVIRYTPWLSGLIYKKVADLSLGFPDVNRIVSLRDQVPVVVYLPVSQELFKLISLSGRKRGSYWVLVLSAYRDMPFVPRLNFSIIHCTCCWYWLLGSGSITNMSDICYATSKTVPQPLVVLIISLRFSNSSPVE